MSAIQSGLRDAIQAAVPPLYAVRAMSTGVWCWTTSFLSKHIDFHVSVAPSRYGVQHCESDNDTWQPELLPLPLSPPCSTSTKPSVLTSSKRSPPPTSPAASAIPPAPSASCVISSATTLRNAPPSSASRNADLNLLPPAIGSVIWRWPCASAISPSMTCSANSLPPATPSASIPSPSCSVRRASRVFPPRRRRTPGYGEAGGRRRRRCAPLGSVPLFLPYPIGRSVPVSAFAGSH